MGDAPYIETPRLVLTWPTAAQIDGFYAATAGSAMFDTISWDGPGCADDLHEFWSACRRAVSADLAMTVNVAIIERTTDRYVGGVGLRPVDDDPAVLDVGYALSPDAQGRGYATEAVGAVVDGAFGVQLAQRVSATLFVGNLASRRVLDKLGFRHEGTLRRSALKHGDYLDEWMMAITRPDWEARVVGR